MAPVMVSAETMSAAAGHLARNWGDWGYRIGVEGFDDRGAVFVCRASDGGEFRFGVDRWGNIHDVETETA